MALRVGDATGDDAATNESEIDLRDHFAVCDIDRLRQLFQCATTANNKGFGEGHDSEASSRESGNFVIPVFVGNTFRDRLIVEDRIAYRGNDRDSGGWLATYREMAGD